MTEIKETCESCGTRHPEDLSERCSGCGGQLCPLCAEDGCATCQERDERPLAA